MIQEFLAICAMVGLALLIIAKGDKQLTHVLEGKLFHAGKNQKMAIIAYRRHTKISSVLLFAGGSAILTFSVILFVKENSLFFVCATAGFIILACGIGGRVRSFVAADQELDEL